MNILGSRLRPSLAILDNVKVFGRYSCASWGQVRRLWGSGGHVGPMLGPSLGSL